MPRRTETETPSQRRTNITNLVRVSLTRQFEWAENVNIDELKKPIKLLQNDLLEAASHCSYRDIRWVLEYYWQFQKNRIVSENRLRAASTDQEPSFLVSWIRQVNKTTEDYLYDSLLHFTKELKVGKWLINQPGIANVNAAGLIAYFDIRKAPTAGHFWNIAGLNPDLKWVGKEKAKEIVETVLRNYHEQNNTEFFVTRLNEVSHNQLTLDRDQTLRVQELMAEYGEETVNSSLVTAYKVYQRNFPQGPMNVDEFLNNYPLAIDIYRQLLTDQNIVTPTNQGIPFSVVRAVAEQIGRHPYNFLKQVQNDEGIVTKENLIKKASMLPYNQRLKTLLLNSIGECFVKFQGKTVKNKAEDFYGRYFREMRDREGEMNDRGQFRAQAEQALREKSYHNDTNAKKAYLQGKLPDQQLHYRARRRVMKLFVSHLHHVMYVDYYGQEPPMPFPINPQIHDRRPDLRVHRHYIPVPNWSPTMYGGKSLRELLD